jgi:hypothetical protein
VNCAQFFELSSVFFESQSIHISAIYPCYFCWFFTFNSVSPWIVLPKTIGQVLSECNCLVILCSVMYCSLGLCVVLWVLLSYSLSSIIEQAGPCRSCGSESCVTIRHHFRLWLKSARHPCGDLVRGAVEWRNESD